MSSLQKSAAAGLPANVLSDKVIQRLLEAEKALGQAVQVDQVKLVLDAASAQQVFAQRQKLGEDVIGFAHTIKTRALARLGELLSQIDKQAGARGAAGPGRGKRGTVQEPRFDAPPTLADLGIDKKTSAIAQQLAALPAETREAIAQREQNLTEVLRNTKQAERRQERIETIVEISRGNAELDVDATYAVVYADPPWRYEHVKTESRAIENQYPTMTVDEICALKVNALATPDAVLFMWATSPKLYEAMEVLSAWGFTYRTSMVWVKDQIGMGYYARQRHELLLIATQGNPPVPEPANRPDSVVNAPRVEHSAKPHLFYDVIERMYPELPKIELFCRSPREGWAVWGNQSGANA